MRARRIILRTGAVSLAVVAGGLVFLDLRMSLGRRRIAAREAGQPPVERLAPFGSVRTLSMIPLSEFYAESEELRTEAGVSYLIHAGDTTILMDTGANWRREHPSPLLHNMGVLGVDPSGIDLLFFSHLHADHTGGLGPFSISQGAVPLPAVPAYVPAAAAPSQYNPAPKVEIVTGPRTLGQGLASIGPIARSLFLLGETSEQALAVNLEGKGIVIFIGCGHQGISRIVERAHALFAEPIYAVIGGLHLPKGGGRAMVGPLDMQFIVAGDSFPWPWRGEEDVNEALAVLQREQPAIVALSPHDSSDMSLDRFRRAFGDRYRELRVGRRIDF